MDLKIKISIPDLWGDGVFEKNDWGSINYLVGPNATGKTRFTEQLRKQCHDQGLKVRPLSSERLAGLEKQGYVDFAFSQLDRGLDISRLSNYKSQGKTWALSADAFVILKEKLDIKIRIEATLSQLFGRRIRLAEESGFLKPKVQRIDGGTEYVLKDSECHGLKELIPLLTFLYDDDNDCLIIDEPELHLHPQFQMFLLEEIRKVAGNPLSSKGKKCFFIVSHSPYYVDVRTIEDLKHCIVFHANKSPTFIDQFQGEDEVRIKRLLPRLNTHHKQFFFASRPTFVEGYFDQQLMTLIQEKRGKLLGASGACIIDVNGKEELDLFFRICRKLNIDARFITDLDVITGGQLRQSVSKDVRCQEYVRKEGIGQDSMQATGEIEKETTDCLNQLENNMKAISVSDKLLKNFQDALAEITESVEKGVLEKKHGLEKKRYIFLVALRYCRDQINANISNNVSKLALVEGRLQKLLEAFKCSGVHVLSKGELENYLPEYKGDPYSIPEGAKQRTFEHERDFLLEEELTDEQFRTRYGELIDVLDEATGAKVIDIDSYLTNAVRDWIYSVQSAYNRDEVKDEASLKRNPTIDWQTHSRIFDSLEFALKDKNKKGFTCSVKLKSSLDRKERRITFDDAVSAARYDLAEDHSSSTENCG